MERRLSTRSKTGYATTFGSQDIARIIRARATPMISVSLLLTRGYFAEAMPLAVGTIAARRGRCLRIRWIYRRWFRRWCGRRLRWRGRRRSRRRSYRPRRWRSILSVGIITVARVAIRVGTISVWIVSVRIWVSVIVIRIWIVGVWRVIRISVT